MPHPALHRNGTLILFSALFALLSFSIPGGARRAAAVNAGIMVDPNSLSMTVPLGQSVTRTVTVTNSSNGPLTPTLFEAYPDAAPAALASARPTSARRAVALPQQNERIDSQILSGAQSALDRKTDFLVYMRDQADLSAAYQIKDWAERGRYVYQTLVDQAERSQRDLRGQLAARGLRYRSLWIVNAVLVHGEQADAQALAARADVALIRANRVAELPQPALEPGAAGDRCSPDQAGNPICWNIRRIGADRVWRDFGVTGKGIVVASIDTGVRYDHPALVAHYRGALGDGRFDHNYNWYDPHGAIATPEDSHGHGTHTMGTIVASSDGTGQMPAVGVAPGARWIAAEGCASGFCNDADLIASAQWMLAPTTLNGANPRPDLRPLIINNSWGGDRGNQDWYSGYTAAWRAAGIFPVFAVGNTSGDTRQVCGSVKSPGDYDDVVSVGATDQNDTITYFSLFGPSRDGRRKPDFVAPGESVLSTYAGDGASYQSLSGTSMAAPQVAGLVALLWSANPALVGDYDTTYALIRDSAHGRSDTRCDDPAGAPNNVYGYGRIDAYAAVARARVDVPWLTVASPPESIAAGASAEIAVTVDAGRVPGPGTYTARLQLYSADLTQPATTVAIAMIITPASQQATLTGRVVSAETGAPVAATVGVKDGLSVQTDSSGIYTLTLAAGAYEIVARASSFLPETLKVLLVANQQAPDIVMQPDQPRVAVATAPLTTSVAIEQRPTLTFPIGNTGTQPLYYHVRVLPDKFAIARSDQPGGPVYDWVDLPPDASVLKLGDNDFKDNVPLGITFPFYGKTLTETLVTADGTLAFSTPAQQYRGPLNYCMPITEFHFFVIAPFRTDLDPSSGGAIRYGNIDGGSTFVLSYEDIPLHGGPAERTYSFQVLLHTDGRIDFQYGALAPLPPVLSVGVQYSDYEPEQLGCGPTTPISQQLAIELQPQVDASQWLHAPVKQGQVLPAGQQPITVTVDWAPPSVAGLERGRVEITSNDPLRSTTIVPVYADMLEAPHSFWVPVVGSRRL